MPRKTHRSNSDTSHSVSKRLKTDSDIDPVKAYIQGRLERLARDIEKVQTDVVFDGRELTSTDVERFDVFFRVTEGVLKDVKREVNWKRATLVNEAIRNGTLPAHTGHKYHDYLGSSR